MKVRAIENSPENFLFTDRTYTLINVKDGRATIKDDLTNLTTAVKVGRILLIEGNSTGGPALA
ncbi:hypothetical protein RCIP0044_00020 [Klebsiella phage RCIP0044]